MNSIPSEKDVIDNHISLYIFIESTIVLHCTSFIETEFVEDIEIDVKVYSNMLSFMVQSDYFSWNRNLNVSNDGL